MKFSHRDSRRAFTSKLQKTAQKMGYTEPPLKFKPYLVLMHYRVQRQRMGIKSAAQWRWGGFAMAAAHSMCRAQRHGSTKWLTAVASQKGDSTAQHIEDSLPWKEVELKRRAYQRRRRQWPPPSNLISCFWFVAYHWMDAHGDKSSGAASISCSIGPRLCLNAIYLSGATWCPSVAAPKWISRRKRQWSKQRSAGLA